jgi:hypothetical protein
MVNIRTEQKHAHIGSSNNRVDSSTQTEVELPPTIPLPPQVEVLRASTNKVCWLNTRIFVLLRVLAAQSTYEVCSPCG